MKKIKLAALLALAGAGMALQSAHAQLTYNSGDLFIGFRNSGSGVTNDYLVDVGQASLYTQRNFSTFTLSIGSTAADLNAAFGTTGSGWLTSGKTNWGVIGAESPGDPTSTLYVGHKEATFGTYPGNPLPSSGSPGSTYLRDSTGNQTPYLSNEQTMRIDYQQNGTATSNSTVGTLQSTSDSSAWLNFSVSPAFGNYAGFEATINSSLSSNVGHAIDLFQIVPDDVTPGTLSPVYEGRFVIDTNGGITYFSTPEPTTLATLAGGAALLGLIRRRRAVAA